MHNPSDLDRQPEADAPPRRLVSMSLGLMSASFLVLGALIGSLVGHFGLSDAFGFGHDVIVGGILGAIIGFFASAAAVKTATAVIAARHRNES